MKKIKLRHIKSEKHNRFRREEENRFNDLFQKNITLKELIKYQLKNLGSKVIS